MTQNIKDILGKLGFETVTTNKAPNDTDVKRLICRIFGSFSPINFRLKKFTSFPRITEISSDLSFYIPFLSNFQSYVYIFSAKMSRKLEITHKDFKKPRHFDDYEPMICYDAPVAAIVDRRTYDEKRQALLKGEQILLLDVPKREARCFKVLKGELCRISLPEGPQVGDLNLWNLDNFKERFYSGKTRQLHGSHLRMYDRLWSNFPYLNPMATFVYDTLCQYGIDKDGGALHDVIGTRCDDYTYKLITGKDRVGSCHSNLMKAVREYGLKEEDVHDVWNVFMCTGFTRVYYLKFSAESIWINWLFSNAGYPAIFC